MKAVDIPARFPEPFAKNATGSYKRTIPATSLDPVAASLDLGFPPDTFVPPGAGGTPPDGRDVNGILFESTAWNQWQSAGGPVPYDPTFSTAVGGYPKGALLTGAQLGLVWISLADDNTTDPDTGGAGWAIFARIRLTANTTFYVATTGNDSNDGLTVGTPWLTIQHAVVVLQASYDLAGFTATIQLADGAYTAGATVQGRFTGATLATSVVIQGNVVTPASVTVSAANAQCFAATYGAAFAIAGITLSTTGAGGISNSCVYAAYHGTVAILSSVVFAAAVVHITADALGAINCTTNYAISAGAIFHNVSQFGGTLNISGVTVTLTGTPAFSGAFASVNAAATANLSGNTYTGAATGTRYAAQSNGVIYTNGAGAGYLPGNVNGSSLTGGQYV